MSKLKFIILSEFAELLDLAMHLKFMEEHDVLMHVSNHDYAKIGDGIIEKVKNWFDCLGKGYIWIIDGNEAGRLQDWLRSKGEIVFGGSEQGDRLENQRTLGQQLFKAAGFNQVISKNFKSIEEALRFIHKNVSKKWILKQNGSAPKSINHKAHFNDNSDLILHLEGLKKKWNETDYGKFDCDLMEVVEGMEVAASVFFNGKNYMKNKDGKVVGFLNWEHKKEVDGDQGEVTGEMGTLFFGTTEDNPLFREIIMRPKIIEALRATKFRGVFDINCIKTKDGIVALEPTLRFGIPSTSYEFLVAMDNCGETIKLIAEGKDDPISIKKGFGMVVVVVGKPFPVEADIDEIATSLGEKLWLIENNKPVSELTKDQRQRVHLQNFYKDEEGNYRVATKHGYLLTVTGKGETISGVREDILKYIKENIYISGMKYRTDIGKRVEGHGISSDQKIKKEYEDKIESIKKDHETELEKIKEEKEQSLTKVKKTIKDIIYGN